MRLITMIVKSDAEKSYVDEQQCDDNVAPEAQTSQAIEMIKNKLQN
jgi:hypothetical protein